MVVVNTAYNRFYFIPLLFKENIFYIIITFFLEGEYILYLSCSFAIDGEHHLYYCSKNTSLCSSNFNFLKLVMKPALNKIWKHLLFSKLSIKISSV